MHSEEYARRQAPTSLKAERNLTRTRTSILKPVSSNFTPDGAAHDTRYAALASACHRGAERRISGCSSAASCPPTAARRFGGAWALGSSRSAPVVRFVHRSLSTPSGTTARLERSTTETIPSPALLTRAGSLMMFRNDGFRRAVSMPPRYVRCTPASSASRSWDHSFCPRSLRKDLYDVCIDAILAGIGLAFCYPGSFGVCEMSGRQMRLVLYRIARNRQNRLGEGISAFAICW
jgi:hypothetical protein